jgi:hypothetical protein
MDTTDQIVLALSTMIGVAASAAIATAQVPESIAAPGKRGAGSSCWGRAGLWMQSQSWCQAHLAVREPIATLIVDGKTVGRHYAGSNWELTDGSAIVGKADAPGKDASDIPWLKLHSAAMEH